MEIIPAIDIIDGKCVRLAKGDFEKKLFTMTTHWRVAKKFEESGIKRLHIVDLDGANWQPLKNLETLNNFKKHLIVIDFGGGIKTTEDLQSVIDAGAAMVSVGSITVKDPDLFYEWINGFLARKNFCRAQMSLIKK